MLSTHSGFSFQWLFLSVLFFSGCYQKNMVVDYRDSLLPEGLSGAMPPIDRRYAIDIDAERVKLTKAYFKIHNRNLYQQLPPGNDASAIGFQPRLVVVHYTVIPTLEKTIATFNPKTIDGGRQIVARNGSLNVGIHFVVDRDGAIYSHYPENVMARHVIGLNHVAIGIENIGDRDLGASLTDGEGVPLTDAQLSANVALIRYLAGKYPGLNYLIGHSEYRDLESKEHPAHSLFQEDVEGYRTEKSDPGRRFMEALRSRLKEPVNIN